MVADALADLQSQGADSYILDLRGNPGGYIVAAQDIASEFVTSGELLFTVESGEDVQEWRATEGLLQDDTPVVVLVDAGSASASEIVAAALQENGRATIVGEPTFGKNTVQVWRDLPNGGGLRLTTDRWFTPDHNSVAPDGVQPDVVVASPSDPRELTRIRSSIGRWRSSPRVRRPQPARIRRNSSGSRLPPLITITR